MALFLRTVYKNVDWLYSVCETADTAEPVIQVVIPGVGMYSLYFRLTPEQANWVSSDRDALTNLARGMSADKGRRLFKDQLIDLATYSGHVDFVSEPDSVR